MNFKKHLMEDIKNQLYDLTEVFSIKNKITDSLFNLISNKIAVNLMFNYESFIKHLNASLSYDDFEKIITTHHQQYVAIFYEFWKKINPKIRKNVSETLFLNNFVDLFSEYESSFFKWIYEQSIKKDK